MTADPLNEAFEANRKHLRQVAFRLLGSASDADDALQEAWMRVNRADATAVENLGGWLTTLVARVCLDLLRSKRSRREEPGATREGTVEPEADWLLADSLGPALLIVLEALSPAERVAFVLHDVFDLAFEEIAPIVGRSAAATRQLASRGRRRVRGGQAEADADLKRQRELVDAFFAASRSNDLQGLLAVLAPDVVLRADETALQVAASNKWGTGAGELGPELRGADAVANAFKGRAGGAKPALIDGAAGAVLAVHGEVRSAFAFTFEDGRITEIELVMAPAKLSQLSIVR